MEFNVDPYYDDFEQNAANNNYMRIMFKPGFAVQARELTQIQSILQNQIKRFGDHIFQDGSPVIGGNLTLDNKVKFLKLQETFNNEDIEIDLFDGKVVRSADGLVQAKVITTYYPTDGTPTLLLKYITSNEFAEGAVIKIAGTTTSAQALATSSNGSALVCSINEGVFYVNGFFVKVLDQSTPVNPYGVTANTKIGLEIDDTFVDSDVDTTLLDPAQGSFNYQAPGADRYQFSLRLSTRPLDSVVDESQFFELMRVENGAITKQVKYPVYSELEKTLARRTFDESGDYVVRPFRATVMDGANANNYTLSIEPGKAYVKGFEFETIGTVKVDVPKPRGGADVKSFVDINVDTSYGNFIYATSFRGSNGGFVNVASLEKIDIHCVGSGNVNANIGAQTTANTFYYGNTKIGSVRVKNVIRYSADAFDALTDSNGVYKIYLADLDINPIVAKVTAASSNANTIRFTDKFSPADNAYSNVSITVLPIRLDTVADVYATVEQNKFTVNANNSGTFAGKVNVGDTIRVGEFVRQVTAVATGNLTVNAAFAYTVANSATNPVQVYVQSAMVQNVAGQTRTIVRYNGSTRTAFLDRDFDNSGVANVDSVIQLNFGIDDAKSLVAGPAVANTLNCISLQNAAMNISSFGKLTNGDTYVEDQERGTLIFKLPGTYVSRTSLNNVDYVYNKFIPNRANNGTAGEFTLSQGSGLDSFETVPWADSTSAIQDNLIVVVRNNNGNTSYPNGTILQLTAANVTIGSPATTITVNTAVPDIIAADIFINVKQNDTEDLIRNKTFYSNTVYTYSPFTYPTSNSLANTTVTLPNLGEVAKIDMANGLVWLTNPTYNAVFPGNEISLFIPDVVRVRRVLQGNTTVVPQGDANTTDITANFLVDYGQKDDRYDHTKLILKPGADSPTGMLLVHVDYYHHIYAAGANVSFFSPASYPQIQYDAGSIPVYKSSNGVVYELRDCLDFRPTLPVGATNDVYTVPNIPTPDETTQLSFDHYLARIDKLVLSKDKEFRVIQGKSATSPYPPDDLDDAMTLFIVTLPPYAADIRQVGLKYIDNRRLTMKELASLNKRVERLEFFTSLSNVENLAFADPTQYEDGTEKEKFGVVGENFTNFNIADFKNPDFAVGVDGGFMVPLMENTPLAFKNIVRTNTSKNIRTLSLSYSETPAITQNVVSTAVKISPFLFGRFNGIVDLYPETDFWCSDRLKPEVIAEPVTTFNEVIEQPRFLRELLIEDIDVPTIPFVANNATTVIIETPNTDPPANNTTPNVVVVVQPAEEPPPVVSDDPPSEPAPVILPSLPEVVIPKTDPPIVFAPALPPEPETLPTAASVFTGGGSELFVQTEITFTTPAITGFTESSIPSSTEPVKAPTGGGGRNLEFGVYKYDRN